MAMFEYDIEKRSMVDEITWHGCMDPIVWHIGSTDDSGVSPRWVRWVCT